MGIDHTIEPGGWFPLQDNGADMTVDQLAEWDGYSGNHPSFSDKHGESTAPAVQFVEEHVNKGFGPLFETRGDAEAFLNSQCFPAPWATSPR